MVNIAGTYSFVSQNNFDAYLKAIGKTKVGKICRERFQFCLNNVGIGTIKSALITKTSPDVTIEVTGYHFKIVTHTTMKTITVEFNLGQEYEADPGTDKLKKVIGL